MATFIPYQPPDVRRSRHSSSNRSAPTARQSFKRPATTLDLTARTRNVPVQIRRIPVRNTSETPLSPDTKGQGALDTRCHSDNGWDSDCDLPPLSELLAHDSKAAGAFRLYRRLQLESGSGRVTDGGSLGPCASVGSASGPLLGSSQEEPFVVGSDEDSSEGEGDPQPLLGDSRTAGAVVAVDEDKGEDIDAFAASISASSGDGDPPLHQAPGSEVDVPSKDGSPQEEGDFRTGEEGHADPANAAHHDLSAPLPVSDVDSTPGHRDADCLPPASAGRVYDVFAELHEQYIKQGLIDDSVGRRDRSRSTSPSVPSSCNKIKRQRAPTQTDEPNCNKGLGSRLSVDRCLDSCLEGKGSGDRSDGRRTAGAERRSARYLIGSRAPSSEPLDVVSPANNDLLPVQLDLRPRKRRLSLIESAKATDMSHGKRRSLRISQPSWKKKAADEAKVPRTSGKSDRASPKIRRHSQRLGRGGTLTVHREKLDVEDVFIGDDGSIQCVVRPKSYLLAKEKLVGRELHQRCENLYKLKYGERVLRHADRRL